MQHYTVTYEVEIIADSHEQAAIKGIQFLTEDLSNSYTELSIKTSTDGNNFFCNGPNHIPTKQHIVGITKDSRGLKTIHLVHDGDDAQK